MTVVEHEVVESPTEVLTDTERRARTLEAAALEIEVRGWAKHHARSGGAFCATGAIQAAAGLEPREGDLYGNLALVEKVWGGGFRSAGDDSSNNDPLPMQFNDNQAESVEDVTFLLRWRAEEIRDGRDA